MTAAARAPEHRREAPQGRDRARGRRRRRAPSAGWSASGRTRALLLAGATPVDCSADGAGLRGRAAGTRSAADAARADAHQGGPGHDGGRPRGAAAAARPAGRGVGRAIIVRASTCGREGKQLLRRLLPDLIDPRPARSTEDGVRPADRGVASGPAAAVGGGAAPAGGAAGSGITGVDVGRALAGPPPRGAPARTSGCGRCCSTSSGSDGSRGRRPADAAGALVRRGRRAVGPALRDPCFRGAATARRWTLCSRAAMDRTGRPDTVQASCSAGSTTEPVRAVTGVGRRSTTARSIGYPRLPAVAVRRPGTVLVTPCGRSTPPPIPTTRAAGSSGGSPCTASRSCAREGVDFVFNTPNDQSRPGYLKMGWQLVGKLTPWVQPSSLGSLPAIARSREPAGHWGEPTVVGATAAEVFADEGATEQLLATLPPDDSRLRTRSRRRTCAGATTTTARLPRASRSGLTLPRAPPASGFAAAARPWRPRSARSCARGTIGLASAADPGDGEADRCRLRAAPGRPPRWMAAVPLPGTGPTFVWRDLQSTTFPPVRRSGT